MNCRELVELITDYLEEKLPLSDIARFEQHLATCDGCTNYLYQMRKTIQLSGSLRIDSITTQQCDELTHIFRDWKSG